MLAANFDKASAVLDLAGNILRSHKSSHLLSPLTFFPASSLLTDIFFHEDSSVRDL